MKSKLAFLLVFQVLLFCVGHNCAWAVEIDQTLIRTGILTEQEFSTVRAQSFSGNWTATFHPLTASGTAKTDQPVTSEVVAEGEDLAVSLTRKGILGKISNGKEISAGYEKVVISGGELISLEVPGNPPILAQGTIEVTFNENILVVVNQITIHQALVSSVSKFGPSSEIEALKAYIVMARSRLAFLKEKSLHEGERFDVCDEEHCLPFSGAGHNRELVDILVTMTANQTLEFKGKKIFPRFHHTCGGKTSSAKELLDINDEPYHAAMEDRIDNKGSENCFHSPGFHWSVELSKLDLLDFISLSWAGGADRIFTGWEPLVIDGNGRIVKVVLRGKRPKEINAIEFFDNLQSFFGPNSLKSMRFSMEVQRRSIIFRGMGQGVGLGMCLYGADGMAKKGKKYEEI
ncbi:MAG: SpoIID/LytB domain-containing protein, partial [Candidatus Rifleibacteriota bacterium]